MDILFSFYNVINLCGKMPIQSESITDAIEKLFKTKIDERGRIYIPRPVRQRFSIKLGEKLYIKIENGYFSIYTATAINKLQLTGNPTGDKHDFQTR